MTYKDSLELYDDLIKSGLSETVARIQAHQLGSVTKLIKKIESDLTSLKSTMDIKFNLVYMLGAAIFTICCIPILTKIF